MASRRGACSKCGYSFRLRRDGSVQVHHLYSGSDRNPDPCEGSGKQPKPLTWDMGIPVCAKCADHYTENPFLVEACASVGIEHGKSTAQMLHEYFAGYHGRGHKEDAGA